MKKIYRDCVEEEIAGKIRVHTTNDGHVIESYRLIDGTKRFFATLSGTHWCAHGNTIAEAVSDAIWKDPSRRPSLESLVKEIQEVGKSRKISLNEFRVLTGACSIGCKEAIKQAKHDGSPLTAYEIRDKISKQWGERLIEILGWKK